MRLRSRLTVSLATLSLATLGGAFGVVYFANNRAQERQLDQALLHEAHEEAREAGQHGGGELVISARPGPQANDAGPLTKYAAIYSAEGRVLAQTRSFERSPPQAERLRHEQLDVPFDMWHRSEHLRAVLVHIPSVQHTRLLLAAPRTDLDGDEAFLGRAMLLVFAFAFAWVVLLSFWVVRHFTRGHELIAETARRVASGDLSARVALPRKSDEVVQLARDVNHMIERLSSLLSAHEAFIAHAAHELRSPLTALYGELSHALRKSRNAEQYRFAIEEALDATKRLMTLAEDLLTLARLSEDDATPRELVSLHALIERVQALLTQEAEARQVRVEVRGSAGEVLGHERDLERLLRNLLENAIRHSPPGEIVLVELAQGDTQRVHVQNRGAPIPEHERTRIFEPFVRGSEANREQREGVGLGLAIARQIAARHGGSLALAEPRATGVEFVLTLPRAGRAVRR